MKTKSKIVRMSKVLSMAFVIFLQIYWYKMRKKPKQEWEKLWVKVGERFRNTLFELEGLLIKIGQILSTRGDLLPKAFISQIEDLTDSVPPSSWEEIQKIMEREWGKSLQKHFQSIEKTAVASASIGEVYRGTLQDGTAVAIKVKRPYIDSIVQTDFRILKIILWFADHFVSIPKGFINFKVLYKELKQVIERELDYSMELNTILLFRDRFKESDIVQIPNVYAELSTANVLVMEWMEGIRLSNTDLLDDLSINQEELAQRIISVFLPQWLEPGMFHADPHPGNVQISEEGKIILFDFGMVGEISKSDAAYFQGLIESILTKNYSKAVDCLSKLGFLLPEADLRTIERLLAELISFDPAHLGEIDLIAFQREMNDLIKSMPIQVPTRFVFLGRSFVTIEGIILQLAPGADLIDLSKPVFLEWLNRQENHKWSFLWQWIQSQPIFKLIHSATEFLNAPQKLEYIKEIEQRRQFQFVIYENNKKHLFQLAILGLAGLAAGTYTSNHLIWYGSVSVCLISIFGYFITSYKQTKWMKHMPEKRRGKGEGGL